MEISAAVSDLIAGHQVQDNLAKLERNRFSTKSQKDRTYKAHNFTFFNEIQISF